MIYSEIRDGLGNQLFQYAAGRALAHRLGTTLRLETRWYRKNSDRTLGLNRFCIRASSATLAEEMIIRRWDDPALAGASALVKKLAPNHDLTVLRDPRHHLDEKFFSVNGNVYLSGYWQSEEYFLAIAREIREELTFRTDPDPANLEMLAQIEATNAICLHVRRGDYITVPDFAKRFGNCSLAYYNEAIALTQSRIKNPHFFIFSDDPYWTKRNIKVQGPCTYVTHNTGLSDDEDLRLMSHCKHFIIANSSFSWWSAWLSRNPEKVVIAPDRWYAGYPTPHTIPNSWRRLQTGPSEVGEE